ncbi:MAG TPA: phosphatase PAP2 family protein [Polyangiaceae bacterium]
MSRPTLGWLAPCGVAFALAFSATRAAPAQSTGDSTPVVGPTYSLEAEKDIPLVTIPAVMDFATVLIPEGPPVHCAPLCDRSKVFFLDRGAAGNYSKAWMLESDVALLANAAGQLGILFAAEGWNGLSDLVVIAESTLWADAAHVLTTSAVRRPRPRMYGTEAPLALRMSPSSGLSFFSGHVAFTASITTSVFTTLRKRHESTWSYLALGLGSAATALVATGRVLGGAHFPTDVAAGALVGGSMGFLIPAVHSSRNHLVAVTSGDGGRLVFWTVW